MISCSGQSNHYVICVIHTKHMTCIKTESIVQWDLFCQLKFVQLFHKFEYASNSICKLTVYCPIVLDYILIDQIVAYRCLTILQM